MSEDNLQLNVPAPSAWIVTVRRKAHLHQCLALTKAANLPVARTIEISGTTATDHKILKYFDVSKAAARCLWLFLATPKPRNVVVVCSGRSISLLIWLWKKTTGRSFLSVYIGHPKSPLVFYDMMIIPEHDVPLMMHRRPPSSAIKVVNTFGILTPRTKTGKTRAENSVLVCLGGDNITFSYEGGAFANFLLSLEKIQETHEVRIAFSGRTTSGIRRRVEDKPALRGCVIEARDRAEFLRWQETAGSIFVCPDSVTMISEALASGATVYVPELETLRHDTSDALFVAECRQRRYVLTPKEFPAKAKPVTFPDALPEAVHEVRKAIAQWRNNSR